MEHLSFVKVVHVNFVRLYIRLLLAHTSDLSGHTSEFS